MENLNKQLINALNIGDIENVRHLIGNGADVNTKDDDEWTPLHYVSMLGYKDIAEILIRNGADVNIIDNVWCYEK
mgnify:FL=1